MVQGFCLPKIEIFHTQFPDGFHLNLTPLKSPINSLRKQVPTCKIIIKTYWYWVKSPQDVYRFFLFYGLHPRQLLSIIGALNILNFSNVNYTGLHIIYWQLKNLACSNFTIITFLISTTNLQKNVNLTWLLLILSWNLLTKNHFTNQWRL